MIHNADVLKSPGEAPDASLAPALQALWWLWKGGLKLGPEWERAHAICQSAEGTHAHDLVHALAHWIEGDEANARYWYRRVGRPDRAPNIASEWERIAKVLVSGNPTS